MFATAILLLHILTAPALCYARDAQVEYLGTADGLWRLAPLERIAFPGERITALAVRDGKLYVGKQPTIEETTSEHTLVVSSDHGATFAPIDEGLRDCTLGCGHMAVRQIAFDGDRMFVVAGGNLLVSSDLGLTWKSLFPVSNRPPAVQTCPLQMLPIGTTVLLGGECPLDIGWIGRGTLAADRLGWAAEPRRLEIEGMENRNVQFIRAAGDTIFAAVEGGVLRSGDGGQTFAWALRYPLESSRYPYIRELAVAGGTLVLGGFDKGSFTGYLIASPDGGGTWSDLSPQLGAESEIVTLLATDRAGRLLIGYTAGGTHLLGELRLELLARTRRRSVGH